jgi:hypothetical protein
MEAKKKGTVGPGLVKRLVNLDSSTGGPWELLATGATIPADVRLWSPWQ